MKKSCKSRGKSWKVVQSRAKSWKVVQSRAKSCKVVQSRGKSRKIVQNHRKNNRGTLLNSCCDEKFSLFCVSPKKGKITNTHGNLAQFGRVTAKNPQKFRFLFLPHDQTKFKSRTMSSCFFTRIKTEKKPQTHHQLANMFCANIFLFWSRGSTFYCDC